MINAVVCLFCSETIAHVMSLGGASLRDLILSDNPGSIDDTSAAVLGASLSQAGAVALERLELAGAKVCTVLLAWRCSVGYDLQGVHQRVQTQQRNTSSLMSAMHVLCVCHRKSSTLSICVLENSRYSLMLLLTNKCR